MKHSIFAKAGMAAAALSFIMMIALADCDTVTNLDPKPSPPFVAITAITDVPVQMVTNTPIILSGTVAPSNATNKTIEWGKKTAETTAEATVSSAGEVIAATAGDLKVTATIANGAAGPAAYTQDFTITVYTPETFPTVSAVSVTSSTATVAPGGTATFSATVAGTNSPAQTVTWSIVETTKKESTSISTTGLLTVASDETLAALTIKATSDADPTKEGTATVTVTNGVTITAADDATSVAKGETLQFSATPETVTWEITTTDKHTDTTISNAGLLTVAALETKDSLTIKATTTATPSQSGTITVSVTTPSVPSGGWTAVASSTFGSTHINGITWGGNTFVAVGDTGKMATSSDGGTTWTGIDSITSTFGGAHINGITWGNNTFVAVGNTGKMATSPDGTNWTAVTSAQSTFNSTAIYGIAYGNNMFVAVGQGSKIATSPDGETWTAVTSLPFRSHQTINGIAWNGSTFVAVSDDGQMATSSNGTNWTLVADSKFIRAGYSVIYGIAWGNNKFVAGGSCGQMATSPDGTNWTAVSAQSIFGYNPADRIRGIAWGGDKFVAVGDCGKMAYSADGTNWTAIAPGSGQFGTGQFGYGDIIFGIAWGDDKFVAVGQGGRMAYWDGIVE